MRAALVRVRALRVTPIYAGLVLALWTVSLFASPSAWGRVVSANSTNVANLTDGRVYTLLSSALVLENRSHVLGVVALLAIVGAGEMVWGWASAAAVFLFGHIMATLVVFAGLLTVISLEQAENGLDTVADVGISYGAVTVIGALLTYLPLRQRWTWIVSALAVGLAVAVTHDTFTDFGHLTALVLGFAAGFVLRRTARSARAVSRPTHSIDVGR